jgi:hypothetical protein
MKLHMSEVWEKTEGGELALPHRVGIRGGEEVGRWKECPTKLSPSPTSLNE